MQFDWDDRQESLYLSFRELGRRTLRTDMGERDLQAAFNHEAWKSCADNGILQLLLPAAYGGSECDPVTYAHAMEGLGYGCDDNGLLLSLSAHTLAVEVPILLFANESQRFKYLPGLGAGRLIGANAMTEPATGSDALALSTVAAKDGSSYRLTGRKICVTNAPIADVFIVYATANPELGFSGVTAFLVESGDTGIAIKNGPAKMGMRTSPWGELELDGCRVSAARRLGRERQGSAIFAQAMAWERALLLAPWLGVMDRVIDQTITYSRQRRQFGKHIGHFQSVSNRIVDMRVSLEASRLLTYRAAYGLGGHQTSIMPEISKLHASESAVAILAGAIQTYGALGYTEEGNLERHLRDVIGLTISSGTADMQRVIVSSKLGIAWPEVLGTERTHDESS
jgi:alkylation response protein AidB-like acyl-CoA dehydrogenase